KDYTFYIFKDNPGYTKAALAANPNAISAGDMIIKSPPIPDSGNKAEWDLKPIARDLKQKLKELFTPVKVAVLGTSKDTNHDPKKRLADMDTFTLGRGVPELRLTAEAGAIPVPQKIALKVEFRNLDSVNLKVEPAGPITLSKTSVNGSEVVTITAVKDGKATITATGVEFGQNTNTTQKVDIESIGFQVKMNMVGFTPA
ncbi:MAG TPA: hypothetical protein VHF22_11315, partial [Planctomycetota bacterium]|nr:hypothetical protein [Planctomycetota bacterium]